MSKDREAGLARAVEQLAAARKADDAATDVAWDVVADLPIDRKPVARPVVAPSQERLNPQELTSVYALLAWVAHTQNVRQDMVQAVMEAEFGVDHVAKLERANYQRAVAFLVDLRLDELN